MKFKIFAETSLFPCSWGYNFVGNVIGIILIDIKQMVVYMGYKFVDKGHKQTQQTLAPHEQWWIYISKQNSGYY